jgi:hypothetical protein
MKIFENLTITSSNAHQYTALQECEGDLFIRSPVSLPLLTRVTGDLYIQANADANLPSLARVDGDLGISNKGPTNLPSLREVGGYLAISNFGQEASFPKLTKVGKFLSVNAKSSLPLLTDVMGTLFIRADAELPLLATVLGDFHVYVEANLPSLVFVGGLRVIEATANLPALPNVTAAHPIEPRELNKTVFAILRPGDMVLAVNESHGLATTPIFIRLLEVDRGIQMVELLLADGTTSKWGKMSAGQAVICYGLEPEMKLPEGSTLATQICLLVGEHLASAVAASKEWIPEQAAARIFIAAVAEGTVNDAGGWPAFSEKLSKDRFTASTRFERDRSNVRLRDNLIEADIVDLWDEDVEQAINDGYLTAPSGPRSEESDWLEPLLEYARGMGLLNGYELHAPPNAPHEFAPEPTPH